MVFDEITIVCLILAYILCRWFISGRFGRLLIAIRDDEMRLRFSGYNPTGYKVLVFAVSGAIAGVAVGGRGTLVGAIVGTLLVRYGEYEALCVRIG